MKPPNTDWSSQTRNFAFIVQVLNTLPLTAAVIKRVPIVGQNITPQFVKLTANDNHVTYALVIIDIEGITYGALIDTKTGVSYTSSTVIDRLNKKTIRKQYKRTKTIMSSSTKSISVYSVEIQDSDREFKFQAEINNLEKSVLLKLPNPEYQILQNSYHYAKDIKISDHNKKTDLSVHVIFGVNDITRIKAQE